MLLASIFVGAMFLFPQITFDILGETCEVYNFGAYSVGEDAKLLFPTTHMGILNIIAAILPFGLIFFYKNRMLQLRFCYVEVMLLLGLQLFIGYSIYTLKVDGDNMRYSATAVMPIIAAIFMWLAARGIIKDEALVRSLDRLR